MLWLRIAFDRMDGCQQAELDGVLHRRECRSMITRGDILTSQLGADGSLHLSRRPACSSSSPYQGAGLTHTLLSAVQRRARYQVWKCCDSPQGHGQLPQVRLTRMTMDDNTAHVDCHPNSGDASR